MPGDKCGLRGNFFNLHVLSRCKEAKASENTWHPRYGATVPISSVSSSTSESSTETTRRDFFVAAFLKFGLREKPSGTVIRFVYIASGSTVVANRRYRVVAERRSSGL